jgi:hypothetical protein
VLLNLFYIRKVFLEGTSKSSTAFFTVWGGGGVSSMVIFKGTWQ